MSKVEYKLLKKNTNTKQGPADSDILTELKL